jgi:hypothetical protein
MKALLAGMLVAPFLLVCWWVFLIWQGQKSIPEWQPL